MLYFIFASLIVLLDQLFKYWIELNIAAGETVKLIPGIISLTYAENTGAAFGILAGRLWLLGTVSGICILVLVLMLIKYKTSSVGKIALAMILGGAIGNFVDRILIGYVVDMFDFQFMSFAIFNIADIFVSIGCVLFCIEIIVESVRAAKAGGGKHLSAGRGQEMPVKSLYEPVADFDEAVKKRSAEKHFGIDDYSVEVSELELTETRILEEFDLERRMREYDGEE